MVLISINSSILSSAWHEQGIGCSFMWSHHLTTNRLTVLSLSCHSQTEQTAPSCGKSEKVFYFKRVNIQIQIASSWHTLALRCDSGVVHINDNIKITLRRSTTLSSQTLTDAFLSNRQRRDKKSIHCRIVAMPLDR